MKSPLRRTAATLFLSVGLLAGQAQASPVKFLLDVAFDAGPLAGQTASGSFSVDGASCPAGVCGGTFSFFNGGLLDFRVTVDGALFTASMDSDHPYFPEIGLDNNAMTFLTFFAGKELPWLSLSAFSAGDTLLSSGYYTPADDLTSYVAGNGITAAVVPEPSTVLMLALGLAGVVGVSRRRLPQGPAPR